MGFYIGILEKCADQIQRELFYVRFQICSEILSDIRIMEIYTAAVKLNFIA